LGTWESTNLVARKRRLPGQPALSKVEGASPAPGSSLLGAGRMQHKCASIRLLRRRNQLIKNELPPQPAKSATKVYSIFAFLAKTQIS
jgi:hypothetical protein